MARTTQKNLLPLTEAKKFVQKLGIKNCREFRNAYKEGRFPDGIPYEPNTTYKNQGWIDWFEFLGMGKTTQKNLLPLAEAKKIVQKLGIIFWRDYKKAYTNHNGYTKHKLPNGMPFSPQKSYENQGWKSWDDFVGNKETDFREAKKIVKKLGIKSSMQYKEYFKLKKLPKEMSAEPARTYKNKGWTNWFEFLGKKVINYFSYEEAKKIAQKLGIKTSVQYLQYYRLNKLPEGMPMSPHNSFKDKGWTYWNYFLGTREYRWVLSFDEAKKIAQEYGIKSAQQYRKYYDLGKFPFGMPRQPNVVFRFMKKNKRRVEKS